MVISTLPVPFPNGFVGSTPITVAVNVSSVGLTKSPIENSCFLHAVKVSALSTHSIAIIFLYVSIILFF